MKIELKLLKSKEPGKEGHLLVFEFSHKGKRKQKVVGHSEVKHFSEEAKALTPKHPDYDVLQPRLMELQLRARKIVLSGITDIEAAYVSLFKEDRPDVKIRAFADEWMAHQRELAAVAEGKGDIVGRNRINGNIKVIENAVTQFENVLPGITFGRLDYETLLFFRKQQEKAGNAASTIHLYMRSIRTLYNRAVKQYRWTDAKPFEDVFSGLKIKSYDSKKKHLDVRSLRILEKLDLTGSLARSRDLWLLQFYFGGADLVDIYYLKKYQIRKGRVWFERGKVSGGGVVDLKIHPKALAILERYPSGDEWQFPWRKDEKGYEVFRRRVQKNLKEIQAVQNAAADEAKDKTLRIDVLPAGGNLAPKVARHTFATMGKDIMIDVDVLRELMGHRRNDVDNYYKDKHKEAVRDAALWKIIQ